MPAMGSIDFVAYHVWTYMYLQYMALLFMSLSIAQLDRLPFGVLEVMISNPVRVSRI